jgi:hypothetical protein
VSLSDGGHAVREQKGNLVFRVWLSCFRIAAFYVDSANEGGLPRGYMGSFLTCVGGLPGQFDHYYVD